MSPRVSALLGAFLICSIFAANASSAEAALTFSATVANADASPVTRAGSHPDAFSAQISTSPAASVRDLTIHLPPGLLINPTAIWECSAISFATPRSQTKPSSLSGENCPNASQVGVIGVNKGDTTRFFGLFVVVPPNGSVATLAASPFGTPLVFQVHLRETDYGLDLDLEDMPQSFDLQAFDLTVWGTPWEGTAAAKPTDPVPLDGHNPQRGNCLNEQTGGSEGGCLVFGTGGAAPEWEIHSFLTMPTITCGAPLIYTAEADTWQGAHDQATVQGPVVTNCNKPLTIPSVKLMSDAAAVRTGLAFNLAVNDGGGILNPHGIARPPLKEAILSLPEGLTINPSLGAGLGTCTEAEFARDTATSEPGAGCPNASKIGEVTGDGVLGIEEPLRGAVYLARPYDNPYGAFLGLYVIARSARRGLAVKSYGKLELDPHSGRIIATYDQLPQLLYTNFSLTLREGQRSTLVSPPGCGTYPSNLQYASWSTPNIFKTEKSVFAINRSDDGGPCPAIGAQPFNPGLIAGSINPLAAAHTPFYLRMTRTDIDQEITSYSATLPPGLLGKIAGIPLCPDSAIEAARARTGIHGGQEELDAPSCPAASSIGHTLAGYGVGGVLTYAPGGLYLAGPYHGSPLSTVAIDSALIGPFDLGVVVVRSALRVDPRSAQVAIDSAGSDPIPHIIRGIPLHLRDIRVYIDRPDFTLNPTTCNPSQAVSTLTGAGVDLFSAADDSVANSTQRYQVLNCTSLPFKPKLKFRFLSGFKRRAFPVLRTELRANPGDANLHFVSVTLPRTEFIAQEHLRNFCTKAQYAADACPPDSVYGTARAFTPLLDQPLEGPVYLRSSDDSGLPDMVFALRGPGGMPIEVVGKIDSVHGGLRATFTDLPDGPLTKFVMTLYGGDKGLIQNEKNICNFPQFANVRMIGQNNTGEATKPRLETRCPKRARGGRGRAG